MIAPTLKKIFLSCCPVCLGSRLEKDVFVSIRGFMSEEGFSHTRCLECDSYFVDPQPAQEELAVFYKSSATERQVEEKIARDATARITDPTRFDYFYKHRVLPIKARLPKNAKVFDAGCGVGCFVKAMKAEGYDVAGSDMSEGSIAIGRETFKLSDKELFVGDIFSMPAHGYDLISAWTVIEHLPDPEKFLNFANSRLKKGGFLLIEFPTIDSLMFEKLQQSFFWIMPPYHLFLFSIKGMAALLSRSGFHIEELYPMPRNWYWFDAIAKNVTLPLEVADYIKANAGKFVLKLETCLDEIAYSMGKSSVVQLICQKN